MVKRHGLERRVSGVLAQEPRLTHKDEYMAGLGGGHEDLVVDTPIGEPLINSGRARLIAVDGNERPQALGAGADAGRAGRPIDLMTPFHRRLLRKFGVATRTPRR